MCRARVKGPAVRMENVSALNIRSTWIASNPCSHPAVRLAHLSVQVLAILSVAVTVLAMATTPTALAQMTPSLLRSLRFVLPRALAGWTARGEGQPQEFVKDGHVLVYRIVK